MTSNASRRSFISTALGAAALPSLAGAAAKSDTPGTLKLGVASYSFREFGRHLAIQDTKKLGVSYINIKDVHLPLNSTPEEIAISIAAEIIHEKNKH